MTAIRAFLCEAITDPGAWHGACTKVVHERLATLGRRHGAPPRGAGRGRAVGRAGGAAGDQGAARLQRVGRARDDGGLRSALHAALVPQVVGAARGEHRVRRGLVPGARSGRRHAAGRLRLRQRVLGDPGDRADHLPRRLADQRLCGAPRRRHGPVDPRCRLRLHRLDHHLADLRQLHLHFLRARGGHHGVRDRTRVRHPAGLGLPAVFAGGDPAGHARRDDDQPAASLDPAAVAADADRAARLRAAPASGRARRDLAVRWPGARRHAARPRLRPAEVRRGDDGRHCLDHADGRTSRLPALHA